MAFLSDPFPAAELDAGEAFCLATIHAGESKIVSAVLDV